MRATVRAGVGALDIPPLYACHSGRGPFVVGVRGGKCLPIMRRITMAQYLLSVHTVKGEAREPMSEEEMRQFMERVGVLERSEEHTSELQSLAYLVCRLLLEKKKK